MQIIFLIECSSGFNNNLNSGALCFMARRVTSSRLWSTLLVISSNFGLYVIIAQWKFPSHLEFVNVNFVYFTFQDAPVCKTQVISKNFNKTTTVLLTPNLPYCAFVST